MILAAQDAKPVDYRWMENLGDYANRKPGGKPIYITIRDRASFIKRDAFEAVDGLMWA